MWTTVENISTEVRPVGISVENCGYQIGNLKLTRGVLVMKNLGERFGIKYIQESESSSSLILIFYCLGK